MSAASKKFALSLGLALGLLTPPGQALACYWGSGFSSLCWGTSAYPAYYIPYYFSLFSKPPPWVKPKQLPDVNQATTLIRMAEDERVLWHSNQERMAQGLEPITEQEPLYYYAPREYVYPEYTQERRILTSPQGSRTQGSVTQGSPQVDVQENSPTEISSPNVEWIAPSDKE